MYWTIDSAVWRNVYLHTKHIEFCVRKCDKLVIYRMVMIIYAVRTTSYILNSGVTESYYTKISHELGIWWTINKLKS